MLAHTSHDEICQYEAAGSQPHDQIIEQSRSVASLIVVDTNTAWLRKSIQYHYCYAGHAARASTAPLFDAVHHMQFQYHYQGLAVSMHVELAQIVEIQVCVLSYRYKVSGSRVLALGLFAPRACCPRALAFSLLSFLSFDASICAWSFWPCLV